MRDLGENTPVSYTVFIALYAVSVVAGIMAGLAIIVGWRNLSLSRFVESLRYNLVYVAVVVPVP